MSCAEIEKEYVVDVYEKISSHFDNTRSYVWPAVKNFLNSLSPGQYPNILEVGCGNGRNMMYRPELMIKGCDIVQSFLNICSNKGLSVRYSNQKELLYPDKSFNVVLSIAVLHHLADEGDRKKSIDEIIRILQKDGLCYIQVWKNSENPDVSEGKFINWTDIDSKIVYKRFYYFYCENDFKALFDRDDIEVLNFFEERNNFICIFKKK